MRGQDSTGIIVGQRRKKKNKIYHLSDIGNSSEFFQSDDAHNLLFKQGKSFLIAGHCRAATVGDVTVANAHPFKEQHIIGMHNGTINKLAPPKAEEAFNSDSRQLFKLIADVGLQEASDQAGDKAAMAIVYVDLQTGTLNFYRNEERPLWFMWNDAANTLYWASEPEFLDLVARRNYGVYKQPYKFQAFTRLSFKLGSLDESYENINRPISKVWRPGDYLYEDKNTAVSAPLVKKVEQKAVACHVCHRDKPECDCATTRKVVQLPEHFYGVDGKLIDGDKSYLGWYNIVKSVSRVIEHLQDGCASCKSPRTHKDSVRWFSHKHYFCKDCIDGDPLITEYVKDVKTYEGRMIG